MRTAAGVHRLPHRSAFFDYRCLSTMVINGTQVKLYAWYDNEWGYANRTVELARMVRATRLIRRVDDAFFIPPSLLSGGWIKRHPPTVYAIRLSVGCNNMHAIYRLAPEVRQYLLVTGNYWAFT